MSRRRAQIEFHKRNPTYALNYSKRWKRKKKKEDTDYFRRVALRYHYGITSEDYDKIFRTQCGKCAICARKLTGHKWKNLCVDHDHKTGMIRGLLCHTCNRGLGLFNDSVNHLLTAVKYLKRFQCRAKTK